AAFYQMVLNGGTYNGKRLLSRAVVEMMTTLHTGDIWKSVGYGLAWTIVRDEGGTLQMQSIGTYGHGGAFGTLGWVDPKKDLVGVLMIQSAGGDGPDASNALRQLAAASITE
ncbi:MAG: serine hydrolase, partial [Bryobacteraceae bacterium]